jgi:hypothetical protein
MYALNVDSLLHQTQPRLALRLSDDMGEIHTFGS